MDFTKIPNFNHALLDGQVERIAADPHAPEKKGRVGTGTLIAWSFQHDGRLLYWEGDKHIKIASKFLTGKTGDEVIKVISDHIAIHERHARKVG